MSGTVRQWCRGAIMIGAGLAAAAATPALATFPTFTDWECVIDLEEALGESFAPPLPAEITTSRSAKICFGGATGKVTILCTATVPNWTLGNRFMTGVPCQISRGQCGSSGFAAATSSTLTVLANGLSLLTCSANGS